MPTPPDFSAGAVLTAAQLDKIGLWLIETKDVTAVATMDFTSVFSTDYRGYLLEWDYTQNTSTGDLYLQFRDASGVLATGYTWVWGGQYRQSGVNNWAGFSNQLTASSSAYIGSGSIANERTVGRLEIINPQGTKPIYAMGQATSINYSATLTYTNILGSIQHDATATRTGLRLFPNAGTVTGKFSLYGFRN